MELQVSYSLCTEISKKNFLWKPKKRDNDIIKEYIKKQLKDDKENMQLSIDYPEDPFTGSK